MKGREEPRATRKATELAVKCSKRIDSVEGESEAAERTPEAYGM